QQQRQGIPLGWADAALFRHNGYLVVEQGTFDDLFTRLRDKQFDYVSFGANEVESVFRERAAGVGELQTNDTLLIYYPFPLVFYVNPENTQLARRLSQGMQIITRNGQLDEIFRHHYGDLVERLQLKDRQLIPLTNPLLPPELINFHPNLLADERRSNPGAKRARFPAQHKLSRSAGNWCMLTTVINRMLSDRAGRTLPLKAGTTLSPCAKMARKSVRLLKF